MNEEQNRIFNYLNNYAKGYDQRKTSTEIKNACGLDSGGVTNEHVRDLIRDMILNHNCCIGSMMWVDGYWIIQTKGELDMVINSLKKRSEGLNRRIISLQNNFKEQ